VAKSYRELFSGYQSDPREYLARTFEEVGGYDELVVLRDIRLVSFCEHHMLPFLGKAHIGYLPSDRVVGISKLARVVQGFGRRLQIQEKLTAEIADAIQEILQPRGVGVVIESEHSCMTMRGVNTPGSRLTTSRLTGVVRDDPRTRQEFLEFVRNGRG
jgi:GTP cyclohydrolase I